MILFHYFSGIIFSFQLEDPSANILEKNFNVSSFEELQ